MNYDYLYTFSKNIGWITPREQLLLKNKRVAIAGLGGIGGHHFLNLVRLGLENFNIAEFDTYDKTNVNRQIAAFETNIGESKLNSLVHIARKINHSIELNKFDKLTKDIIPLFLKDCDLYIDGLDFFAIEIREAIFEYCHKNNIPAITVAPIGLGATVISFLPGGISFEEFFQLKTLEPKKKILYFLAGLTPAALYKNYIVYEDAINLKKGKAPVLISACILGSAILTVEAIKILCNRGRVYKAPYVLQYDLYNNTLKKSWRPFGNRNPLQKLLIRKLYDRYFR